MGAFALLAGVAENCVVAGKLDQHPGLAIAQLRRRPAVPRHVVEQALRLTEKLQRRGARHAVLLGLSDRCVDDLGRALEGRVEERLVGLELVPGVDGAAGGGDGEQQEDARQRRPDPVAPPARALGTANDLVEAEAEQPRHHFLLGDLLAVVLWPRIGGDRLLALVAERAVRTELEAQRRREAFALRIARLALDDHRDHPVAAAERLEAAESLH